RYPKESDRQRGEHKSAFSQSFLTFFSRFIHIHRRRVKPHPLQTLHIKPAAPAGFFLPWM
ncbi:hypothetical protein ACMSI6_27785, partial [Pseudomonas antarctica]|uniref:hypothetical protein n=1 Tax=Pseudomonas antarctica TaxID=219572 RepID=UPI0039C39A05